MKFFARLRRRSSKSKKDTTEKCDTFAQGIDHESATELSVATGPKTSDLHLMTPSRRRLRDLDKFAATGRRGFPFSPTMRQLPLRTVVYMRDSETSSQVTSVSNSISVRSRMTSASATKTPRGAIKTARAVTRTPRSHAEVHFAAPTAAQLARERDLQAMRVHRQAEKQANTRTLFAVSGKPTWRL